MKTFRPVLAGTVTVKQLNELDYSTPLRGFYKYDGIRAINFGGNLVSRKLKPIPNVAVRRKFGNCLSFDGELISGLVTAPDVFNRTSSQVMTEDESAVGVNFIVFDHVKLCNAPYWERRERLLDEAKRMHGVIVAPSFPLESTSAVLDFEEHAVKLGYEGIMLRSRDGIYKFGRSTVKEQILLKLKRFKDSEARVLAVNQQMQNCNYKEKDERGYSKRSSKKGGKLPLPSVGGFRVRDVKSGQEFDCGPGVLTQKERLALWLRREELIGKVVKYRFQPAGMKELPRFPRFYGWRSKLDF